MCAICGWLNSNEDLTKEQDRFKKMVELMSCRGKDNTGYHFEENVMLGHKRLAIVDLENRQSTNVCERIRDCVQWRAI